MHKQWSCHLQMPMSARSRWKQTATNECFVIVEIAWQAQALTANWMSAFGS
jgi:hypothetical protein